MPATRRIHNGVVVPAGCKASHAETASVSARRVASHRGNRSRREPSIRSGRVREAAVGMVGRPPPLALRDRHTAPRTSNALDAGAGASTTHTTALCTVCSTAMDAWSAPRHWAASRAGAGASTPDPDPLPEAAAGTTPPVDVHSTTSHSSAVHTASTSVCTQRVSASVCRRGRAPGAQAWVRRSRSRTAPCTRAYAVTHTGRATRGCAVRSLYTRPQCWYRSTMVQDCGATNRRRCHRAASAAAGRAKDPGRGSTAGTVVVSEGAWAPQGRLQPPGGQRQAKQHGG